ncbi:hypothetical protein [uncultured Duncaniella sp.]|uniref:hypothetical protein n=1 Tax=uncultured Duncaniella sp. TaxID=2768039 RepID=UPI0025A9F2E0|nr:hypothetical protein [uncultured Duncaniella sp.]
MTEDNQRKILDNHYKGCLDFWKRQGKDEITAMELALRELEKVTTNPLSPHGEPLAPAIVTETANKYRKMLDEAVEALDPDDENIRRCNNCGKPMKEGYYLGGEYACSDECALALYHGDKAQMEEDLSHAEEDDGECYWTEWESFYFG